MKGKGKYILWEERTDIW